MARTNFDPAAHHDEKAQALVALLKNDLVLLIRPFVQQFIEFAQLACGQLLNNVSALRSRIRFASSAVDESLKKLKGDFMA